MIKVIWSYLKLIWFYGIIILTIAVLPLFQQINFSSEFWRTFTFILFLLMGLGFGFYGIVKIAHNEIMPRIKGKK